jgi:hypothetical protein
MARSKIIRIIAVTVLLASAIYVNAQSPPHPNGGVAPGTGNTVVGGQQGAPIGSGTYILFLLAVAYAGRKVYRQQTSVIGEIQ